MLASARWFTVDSIDWGTTGPGSARPLHGGGWRTAVSGKQAEGSRPLPTVEPGTAYIRKVAGGIYAAPTEWELCPDRKSVV